MKRLQVKYCKGEKELNDFLSTLIVDSSFESDDKPRLHSINYVTEVKGTGDGDEYFMGCTIIAAVQYFVEEK